MTLRPKQLQALDILEEEQNLFLSGEAGTGKSFVIEEFIKRLEKKGKKYAVMAPTGVAALNVGGITIHRAFSMGIKIGSVASMKNIEDVDVIIIDEISMCRVDVFKSIAKAILNFRKKPKKYDEEKEAKRVRNKQIVVVGDFLQLPPIMNADDEAELERLGVIEAGSYGYAFECEEWNMFKFKTVVLDEVVRQSDIDFIDSLNKIRKGDFTGVEFIEKNCNKEADEEALCIYPFKKRVTARNNTMLNKIKKDAKTYWGRTEGTVNPSDLATEKELVLKTGCRVMSVINKNDSIVNGSMGTVIELSKKSVKVAFDEGSVLDFEEHKWSILGYEEIMKNGVKERVQVEIGSFTQIPLKLCYAMTIHKAQGQSYDSVNVNPQSFAPGQLYVALSRARTIDKLHLTDKIKEEDLITSQTVLDFYNKAENPEEEYEGLIKVSKDVETTVTTEVNEEKKEEKTTTKTKKKKTSTKANKELVDNFKKEEIKDFEVEEEYVLMKIPKSLENKVERLINGEVDINTQSEEIKALEDKIKRLEANLEKSNRRRSKISKDKEQEILKLRETGMGMNRIAKEVGVGDGTVRRVLIEYGVK